MKKKLAIIMMGGLFALSAFGQSKKEITGMLDHLAASGAISEAQVNEARKELNSMSDAEVKALVEAGEKMKNDPRIRQKIQEMGLGQ